MPQLDPQHWRHRAVEALSDAATVNDGYFRRQLVQIALAYDILAKRAASEQDPAAVNCETSAPLRDPPVSRSS
jgi:hypothetical protein